nr:truncated phage integrase N-terminal SAM-like domain-containing protein [uncultured bacterium]
MGMTEIEVFLTHLAIAGKASASIRIPTKRALQFFIGRC